MNDMPRFSAAELAQLTAAELAELQAHLELIHLDEMGRNVTTYAKHMEVPGAPVLGEEGQFYPVRLQVMAHHKLILDAAQELIDGPAEGEEAYDGLIIMQPPGSAKSTYGNVVLSSWLLGQKKPYPLDIISTSYGSDLAEGFSRRVRSMVNSPMWTKIFGGAVADSAIGNWSTTIGSAYRCGGILSGITGKRADWLIIDDPVKGREEADSEIIRNKIFAAWQDDLNTRMKPGGKVVIIGTRWHEADLIGALLGTKWEGQSGLWIGTDQRRWYVICLPMIAEHADDPLGRPIGAMLWPEWFREREVKRIRDTSERTWSALYQQRPSATQGNILKADWWKCWPHGKSKPTEKQLDEVERGMDGECVDADKIFMTFLSYDTAFAEGEENDYSAMTAWHAFYTNVKVRPNTYGESKDREKMLNLILAGGWQGKVDTPDLREIVKSHVRIMKPDFILIENKASGIGLIQELRRARIGTQIIAWTPRGVPGTRGKTPRAHQASYTLSTGAVWYVAGKQTASVIKNCAAYPHAANDDWCDTVTQAILYARDTGLQEIDSDAQTPEEMEEMALAKNNSHKRTLYGARPETTGKPKDWNPENRTLYGGRRQ